LGFDWCQPSFLGYVELMFWAQQYKYDKYFTTDASPRIFNVVEFFNRHSEITLGAWNLAKSLNKEQVLEMMKNEDFNGLMKFVNKSIYRI
jgi:xylose isomerase